MPTVTFLETEVLLVGAGPIGIELAVVCIEYAWLRHVILEHVLRLPASRESGQQLVRLTHDGSGHALSRPYCDQARTFVDSAERHCLFRSWANPFHSGRIHAWLRSNHLFRKESAGTAFESVVEIQFGIGPS